MALIAGNMDSSPVILNFGIDFAEDFFAFFKGEEVFYFGVFVVFDCVNELFVCSFLFIPPFLQVFNLLLIILLLLIPLSIPAYILELSELLFLDLHRFFLFPFRSEYLPHPWRWRKVLNVLLVVLVVELISTETFFHLC